VRLHVTALALTTLSPAAQAAGETKPCPTAPVTIQILGSGGPIAEGDRAGTSYLLRVDGVPRVLIDAGPGSFLRYGQAGASLATLDAIVLTHLHVDHTADLAGILKSGSFEGPRPPLPLIGPDGNERFPATGAFLGAWLSAKTGAYRYLSGYLDGSGDLPKLAISEVRTAGGDGAARRFALPHGIMLTAIPVNHGAVPAIGVRIEVGGKAIVIGGDQSAASTGFERALAGSAPDLLIAHHVIPEGPGQPENLHRAPTAIGTLAVALGTKRLILSHNMRRSLDRLDAGLAAIKAHYTGPVTVANDLDCFAP
jgi:ribonuclease BN (tRNA processing enzyme)